MVLLVTLWALLAVTTAVPSPTSAQKLGQTVTIKEKLPTAATAALKEALIGALTLATFAATLAAAKPTEPFLPVAAQIESLIEAVTLAI